MLLRRYEVNKLIPLREVERQLGVTRWTLHELIRRGVLPAIKPPSGHYRVTEDVLLGFAQQETPSQQEVEA